MLLTVRFSHYPSHTPLMELEMEPTTTVGTMKAMVEERLAGDEEGLPRVIANKWHFETTIGSGGKKRLIELLDCDDSDTVSDTGIADFTMVYLEGPTIDTPEGIRKALSVLSHRLRQNQLQQTELLRFVKEGFSRIHEANARIEKRQEHLCAVATLSLSVMLTNEGTGIVNPEEPRSRSRIKAEEEMEFLTLMETFETAKTVLPLQQASSLTARLMEKYGPSLPLQAFWEALNDSATRDDPTVPMAIINDPCCGLEKRSASLGANFVHNGWYPGHGSTPLILAAHAGRLDVVQALVAAGAEINVRDDSAVAGFTPLHYAAANGHAAIIKYLITQGAAVSSTSVDGSTPLKFFELHGVARCPSGQVWGIKRLLQVKDKRL